MNIGTFLMFFPLACVAGEMENPGRDRIRPETAASMKTLCREVTAAEKQSFQNPSFDGTRYSIPDVPPYWEADSRSLVSRSMGRNEANNPCYTETRKTLSPDGLLLTTIRMRKVRDSRPFLKRKFTGPFPVSFCGFPDGYRGKKGGAPLFHFLGCGPFLGGAGPDLRADLFAALPSTGLGRYPVFKLPEV
ncbi:hypothetical protein [Akkermansia muciniphila]|uniref:hypothetical protein n=1 Tax=Akkermansia muciniphila TaxID=239935 RepID=UPI001BFF43FC|nr:hypothetical protein [Akkermansia muciniphila]MBT8778254.1 hypothetical protein [Akkermansia muciniphila]